MLPVSSVSGQYSPATGPSFKPPSPLLSDRTPKHPALGTLDWSRSPSSSVNLDPAANHYPRQAALRHSVYGEFNTFSVDITTPDPPVHIQQDMDGGIWGLFKLN